MSFQAICIFTAQDGEHVGYVNFDVPPNTIPDAEVEKHVRKHFEQREHTKVVRWWRAKGPNDLEETRKAVLAKYPNRTPIQDVTGGTPTRALVDSAAFVPDDEEEESP